MSSKKIGFYFEEQLPDINTPLSDDFSFFYIKNEKSFNDTIINIPDLFLYNKLSNNFIKLSVPVDYYVNKVNGKFSNKGNINISLQDTIDINPNINKPLLINSSSIFSNNSFQIFSDLSTKQLENYISTVKDTLLIGNNFGDKSIELKSINNIFIGENQNLLNKSFNENIIIANNILTLEMNDYSVGNNLFIGGIYYSIKDPEYINNVIQDNIFIKNLGYGNLNENFNLVLPIKLSNNTPIIDNTIENALDKNTDSLLISKNDKPVSKLLLKDFGLNTILSFNNSSDKNIILKNRIIGDYNSSFLMFEDLSNIKNNLLDSIVIGSNSYSNFKTNKSLVLGNNNYVEINDTKIIGNNNYFNWNNSLIFGDLNGNNSVINTTDNNILIGNKNLNLKTNIENEIKFNNSTIIGSNNISNINDIDNSKHFDNNIIIGKDNISENNISENNIIIGKGNLNNGGGSNNLIFGNGIYKTTPETVNNSLLIGNGSEYYLNNNNISEMLIVNHTNDNDKNKLPLILGSFNKNNPWLKVNGKFSLNPLFIENTNYDVTYNKLLSINSDGEIGSVNKNVILPELDNLVYTNGTIDNKNITGELIFKPTDETKSGLSLLNNKSDNIKLSDLTSLNSIQNFESVAIESENTVYVRNYQSQTIQKIINKDVIELFSGQEFGNNIIYDNNYLYSFGTNETNNLIVYKHDLSTLTIDTLLINTNFIDNNISFNKYLLNPTIKGDYIYLYYDNGLFIKFKKDLTEGTILTELAGLQGIVNTSNNNISTFKIIDNYIYTVFKNTLNLSVIYRINIDNGNYESYYTITSNLLTTDPDILWFESDNENNLYIGTDRNSTILCIKNDLTETTIILDTEILPLDKLILNAKIFDNFLVSISSDNKLFTYNLKYKNYKTFDSNLYDKICNINFINNTLFLTYKNNVYYSTKKINKLFLYTDEYGEVKSELLNFQDASKKTSGIVNNIAYQELGGVDKKINDINIGRGSFNDIDSVVLGNQSLSNATGGRKNIAIGSQILNNNSGDNNIGIGYKALSINDTKNSNNIGIGSYSLNFIEGDNNIAIGVNTGTSDKTSNKLYIHSSNSSVGINSLIYGDFSERWLRINGTLILNPTHYTNVTNNPNFNKKLLVNPTDGKIGFADDIAGVPTLQSVTDQGNITTQTITVQKHTFSRGLINDIYSLGIGEKVLGKTQAGSQANTGFGQEVLAELTTGSFNVGVGDYALSELTTGQWNTAIGSSSLSELTTGSYNFSAGTGLYHLKTGSRNSALGVNAGYANESGSFNTYMGERAAYDNGVGNYNVAIGSRAMIISGAGYINGGSTVNMNNNVFIGSNIKGINGLNGILAIDNRGNTQTNYTDALLYGDFEARFLKINGTLILNPNNYNIVTGDPDYNKSLVVKDDGTIGFQTNTIPVAVTTTSESSTTRIRMTSDFTINSTTRSNIPGFTFPVVAGKVYKIRIIGAYKTVVTTTGGSIGFILTEGGVGTIFGSVKMQILHTNTAAPEQAITYINTVATTTRSFATSTGVGTINIPEYLEANLIFECTTDGTFNVQWGSEVASSNATLMKNTILEINEI